MGDWERWRGAGRGEQVLSRGTRDRTPRGMASNRGMTWLRLAPATAPCASRTCIPNNTTRCRCVQWHGPAHRAGTTLAAAGKLAATSCERRRSGPLPGTRSPTRPPCPKRWRLGLYPAGVARGSGACGISECCGPCGLRWVSWWRMVRKLGAESVECAVRGAC